MFMSMSIFMLLLLLNSLQSVGSLRSLVCSSRYCNIIHSAKIRVPASSSRVSALFKIHRNVYKHHWTFKTFAVNADSVADEFYDDNTNKLEVMASGIKRISSDSPESSAAFDDVLLRIAEKRGTADVVDMLISYMRTHPGMELNMDLYRALYSFPFDDFQEEGLKELIRGNNVLVTTPTGSGKTLVGELAIYFALMMGLRVAYTTPLKALSNQKFQDFQRRYGGDRVGLLTGDIAVNRGAAVTVMTTEVFRNMVYDPQSEDQLSNLFMVVFDEFHFMNDRERGTVWEESVISCPPSVRILALSATMGNVEDIQGWMDSIHGPTSLVASDHRPVPLRYFFAMKNHLVPLFRNPQSGPGAVAGILQAVDSDAVDDEFTDSVAALKYSYENPDEVITGSSGKLKKTNKKQRKKSGFGSSSDSNGEGRQLSAGAALNPSITRIEKQQKISQQKYMQRNSGRKRQSDNLLPSYSELAHELHSLEKLPAIIFIFSRMGCEKAAQQVVEKKNRLLTSVENTAVSNAISNFLKANPDIPVSKQSIAMLRAGVGVHHAGLITVWKAFIEDLFNANLIKVLFATETLAAGVNMPARTTVVTSVTKRINSKVIVLKPSQLLQMAGRAGRRGKDLEGNVVLMRNRFEDCTLGHKILTTPVDGIISNFRTSYSLTVTLLATRSLEECRALIQKGFGAYLTRKRRMKKQLKREQRKEDDAIVEGYRDVLRHFSLATAREYLKLLRRTEKEHRALGHLIDKMKDSETELAHAIADYMPMGTGVTLRNGESGFFLGDVKWGYDNRNSGLGVLTRALQLFVVHKGHIRAFAESEHSLPAPTAQALQNLVSSTRDWITHEPREGDVYAEYLEGRINLADAYDDKLLHALEEIKAMPAFPEVQEPGSITRQRMLVKDMEEKLQQHPVVIQGREGDVLDALTYAAQLKDPTGFVNNPGKNYKDGKREGDVFAWVMFQNVVQVLQDFGALRGTNATLLGDLVSSLTGDNELWLALVLQHPSVQTLCEEDFAALMSALMVDGFKLTNAYFQHEPSFSLKEVYRELTPLYTKLQNAQDNSVGLEFPINLNIEAAGMVVSWMNGTSWRDLCRETSLEQGDIYRIIRRTVEFLRQIPTAYGVPPGIVFKADAAAKKMDRFPIADYVESSKNVGQTDEETKSDSKVNDENITDEVASKEGNGEATPVPNDDIVAASDLTQKNASIEGEEEDEDLEDSDELLALQLLDEDNYDVEREDDYMDDEINAAIERLLSDLKDGEQDAADDDVNYLFEGDEDSNINDIIEENE